MPDPGIAELLRRLGSQEPQPAWDFFLETNSGLICEVVRWFERDADEAEDCFLYVCEQLRRQQFRRLRRFDPEGRASFSTWLRAVVRNLCLDWHRRHFGRYRAFRSVAGLSEFDQQVFHYSCELGLGSEQCVEALRQRFPAVCPAEVGTSLERIRKLLNPHQLWLLTARQGRSGLAHPEAMDETAYGHEPVDPSPSPELLAAIRERSDGVRRVLARLPGSDRLLLFLRFEQELTLAEVARVLGLKDPQTADRRIHEVLASIRASLGVDVQSGGKGLAKSV